VSGQPDADCGTPALEGTDTGSPSESPTLSGLVNSTGPDTGDLEVATNRPSCFSTGARGRIWHGHCSGRCFNCGRAEPFSDGDGPGRAAFHAAGRLLEAWKAASNLGTGLQHQIEGGLGGAMQT
jgi:hypothetical protein